MRILYTACKSCPLSISTNYGVALHAACSLGHVRVVHTAHSLSGKIGWVSGEKVRFRRLWLDLVLQQQILNGSRHRYFKLKHTHANGTSLFFSALTYRVFSITTPGSLKFQSHPKGGLYFGGGYCFKCCSNESHVVLLRGQVLCSLVRDMAGKAVLHNPVSIKQTFRQNLVDIVGGWLIIHPCRTFELQHQVLLERL